MDKALSLARADSTWPSSSSDTGERPAEPVRLVGGAEETLIADIRAALSPAELVERKLAALLKGNPPPVSHLVTNSRCRPSWPIQET